MRADEEKIFAQKIQRKLEYCSVFLPEEKEYLINFIKRRIADCDQTIAYLNTWDNIIKKDLQERERFCTGRDHR